MEIALIIGVVAVIIFAGAILIYNGLVQRRLRIDEAYSQIEVQLKRRWDLIPNLVNAVQGYMGFEQKVLTDVTEARAGAVTAGAQGPQAQALAENALTSTLRSLFAVVENYPELKANTNVLELQEQLITTENQISFARQHYNATVLDYNTSIATFPNVLISGPLGFDKRYFFDADPEVEGVPQVDLGFSTTDDDASAQAPAPPHAPPPQAPPPPPPPAQQPPPAQPQQPPPGYRPPPPPQQR
jgi:LemA protein